MAVWGKCCGYIYMGVVRGCLGFEILGGGGPTKKKGTHRAGN